MKLFTLILFSMIIASAAQAEFLPLKKPFDQTTSVVLFEDPFTGFLLRSDNRTLGTVSASIPLYGFDAETIYAYTGIQATLRNQGASFNSETLDLRVGVKWVHPFDQHLFFSVGVSHMSGHVVDDVIEKDLIPFNVGIDGIPVRLVFDSLNHLRSGVYGLYALDSDPVTRKMTAGIFNEYYFGDGKTKEGFMLGSDIYLPENQRIVVSTITELVYRVRQISFMLGFHTGADVRLKQQLFLNSQANFGFTGFRFEI